MNVLLLGGDGFLGQGLQQEFSYRDIQYKSLDIKDFDLHDVKNISKLTDSLEKYDNIVMLASKLGVKLFEIDPINAANYNKQIYDNVISAIKLASEKFKKSFNVTYYSTSEVFCSQKSINDFITENTSYNFDYSNPRHLYAYVKWQAEDELFKINSKHPEIISTVKIIRPFNIYGRNQKRGVLYDMIKSVLKDNTIFYSKDTTRSMTDIDMTNIMSTDIILSTKNLKINIVDARNSLTMEALANIVNDVLCLNCELIELPKDKSIQYRHVSIVNNNIELSKNIMKQHILELAPQVSNSF